MDGRGNRASHGAQLNDVRPFVRVVVPAFNKAELTTSCFRSLLLTVWPRDQLDLVLVDNGSSDETISSVSQLSSDIHVVSSPTNRGFAGGCNLGITACSDHVGRPMQEFDYLALVNNDAEVHPAWLEELVAIAEAQDDVGV
ncbi:MAG: glycosyltransferase, partial [Actinomycetota bacterium]